MWTLILYEWCPYKKKKLDTDTEGNHVKTEGKDCYLQAKERALRRS